MLCLPCTAQAVGVPFRSLYVTKGVIVMNTGHSAGEGGPSEQCKKITRGKQFCWLYVNTLLLSTKPCITINIRMHIYPKSTIHYRVGPCNDSGQLTSAFQPSLPGP